MERVEGGLGLPLADALGPDDADALARGSPARVVLGDDVTRRTCQGPV